MGRRADTLGTRRRLRGAALLLVTTVVGCGTTHEPPRDGDAAGPVNTEPSWSPDGGSVVFTHTDVLGDRGPWQVWIHELPTGLCRFIAIGDRARFSPDGTKLAYIHESSLYVLALDTGTSRQITSYTRVNDVAWTPVLGRIVILRDYQLWLVDELANEDLGYLGVRGISCDVRDDGTILYTSLDEHQLWAIRPEQGAPYLVLDVSPGRLRHPRCAPGATSILLTLFHRPDGRDGLWSYSDDGQLSYLNSGVHGDGEPSGTRIVYQGADGVMILDPGSGTDQLLFDAGCVQTSGALRRNVTQIADRVATRGPRGPQLRARGLNRTGFSGGCST